MKNVFENLAAPIQRAIRAEGFFEPTAIQAQAIPHILQGRDVLGIAQTGTGKTAAFVLPIVQKILLDQRKGLRVLILCPTRELAIQVSDCVRSFTKSTKISHVAIYGGVGQRPQVNALRKGVDILIATPGRLFDLFEQGHFTFDKVDFFVLDEADRMLDMGFIKDINKISKLIPKKRQTLFFSATMSGNINKLANTLLHKPVRVEVTPESTPVEKIEQKVLFVNHEDKVNLLLNLLEEEHLNKVLIFTRTKRGADRLCRVLKKNKISAQQIHGDRSQSQRTRALNAFEMGRTRCLVATDVAARGLDIDDISHVINYDLPMEAENYVHRIGRTARAGADGTAYSFSTAEDMPLLRAIEATIGAPIPVFEHMYHSDKAKESKAQKVFRGRKPARGKSSGKRSGSYKHKKRDFRRKPKGNRPKRQRRK